MQNYDGLYNKRKTNGTVASQSQWEIVQILTPSKCYWIWNWNSVRKILPFITKGAVQGNRYLEYNHDLWQIKLSIYMQLMHPCCSTCCIIAYNLNCCFNTKLSAFQYIKICSISFKDTTVTNKCSWINQVTGISLTTLMFLWIPSKILISLAQSLKLSLRKSSTHKAKASWGLWRTWWRTVTKIFGRAKKRWRSEKNEQLTCHP